eukprot:3390711-Rhodomonas_salina.1
MGCMNGSGARRSLPPCCLHAVSMRVRAGWAEEKRMRARGSDARQQQCARARTHARETTRRSSKSEEESERGGGRGADT